MWDYYPPTFLLRGDDGAEEHDDDHDDDGSHVHVEGLPEDEQAEEREEVAGCWYSSSRGRCAESAWGRGRTLEPCGRRQRMSALASARCRQRVVLMSQCAIPPSSSDDPEPAVSGKEHPVTPRHRPMFLDG